MIYITKHKHNKSNSGKLITVCNYGYFLERGKWEAIVLTFAKIEFWIWRKKEYSEKWPNRCI